MLLFCNLDTENSSPSRCLQRTYHRRRLSGSRERWVFCFDFGVRSTEGALTWRLYFVFVPCALFGLWNFQCTAPWTLLFAVTNCPQLKALSSSPPEGIAYVPNDSSSLAEIHAEIAGPEGTPYHGKFFHLKLVLSGDFPNSPPRGFFLTKIYHPNVNIETGDICVNTLKRDWTSTTTISHVLSVIRCLLIVPFPESSLNDEAGKLFMDSYEEYERRARLMAGVHGRVESAVHKRKVSILCGWISLLRGSWLWLWQDDLANPNPNPNQIR